MSGVAAAFGRKIISAAATAMVGYEISEHTKNEKPMEMKPEIKINMPETHEYNLDKEILYGLLVLVVILIAVIARFLFKRPIV